MGKPPSPYLWIVSQRWSTLLHVQRRYQQRNTPSSSSIMCSNCHRCICGSSLKDGSLCSMYKGDISREIHPALHRSCVQISWFTRSYYLQQRPKVHQPVLEGIVPEARNGSLVQYGLPPANGWPVGADDQST